MGVCDGNFIWPLLCPTKDEAPLLIDPNRIKASEISFESFEAMVGVGDRAEGNPGSPLCDDFTRVDLIARIGNGLRTGEPA